MFSQHYQVSARSIHHHSIGSIESVRTSSTSALTLDTETCTGPRLNSRERRRIRRAEEQRLKREAEAQAASGTLSVAAGDRNALCNTSALPITPQTFSSYKQKTSEELHGASPAAVASSEDSKVIPTASKLNATAKPFTPTFLGEMAGTSYKFPMPYVQPRTPGGKRHSLSIAYPSSPKSYRNISSLLEHTGFQGHRHSLSTPNSVRPDYCVVSAERKEQMGRISCTSSTNAPLDNGWVVASHEIGAYGDFLRHYSYGGFESFGDASGLLITAAPSDSSPRTCHFPVPRSKVIQPIEATQSFFEVLEGGFPSVFSVPRAVDFSYGSAEGPSIRDRRGSYVESTYINARECIKDDPDVDHLADLNFLMDVRRMSKRLDDGVFRRRESREFGLLDVKQRLSPASPTLPSEESSPASTFSSLYSDITS